MIVRNAVLAGALALAAVGATSATDTAPHESREAYIARESGALIESQLVELEAGRHCTRTPRLAPIVLVRNAARDGAGRIQFDTTVVRAVPLAQAFDDAAAGRTYSLAWCDR